MVWVKKAAAPDFSNVIEDIPAILSGTPNAWLIPWLEMTPLGVLDVAAFCAAGPPEPMPFTWEDFQGFATRPTLVGGALGVIALGPKLAAAATERLFAAYCENTYAGSFWSEWECETDTGPYNTQSFHLIPVPLWATHYEARLRNVFSGSRNDAQVTFGLCDNVPGGANWTTVRIHSQGGGTIAPEWDGPAMVTVAGRQAVWWGPAYECTATFCVRFYGPAGAQQYPIPVFEQPPTALLPPARTYTTTADLGAELDRIETKLHWLLEAATMQTVATSFPLAPAAEPVEMTPEDELAIGPDIGGLIVTLSGLIPSASADFGEPFSLSRAGRVVLGTASAWLAPIPITVSPMLVAQLAPGITRVRVHAFPPATVTVQKLARAAAVG